MRVAWAVVVAVALAGCAARARAADVSPGVRGSISDDADFGIGVDVRWTFLPADRRLALVGTFDYFFPQTEDFDPEQLPFFEDLFPELGLDLDTDLRYWEANLNLTWDFTTGRSVVPYAGLGVNYARAESSFLGVEVDEDDFGANVLAGLRIGRRVFVEAKQEAGGGELFVLTAGVRF